ncbi:MULTISPECIES: ATP-binding protein [Caballeronia]|uniref:hybrid sensor histidine kinase/response regulator n=1 Tax=Caballeronia TaxID=1827195 RepID=UPI00025BB1B2|nr:MULTISPECIES: ATP-binding protein [Caballeronia]EKS71949.1 Signal transduction histidine Kinases (STHK) [Burkholderia sp. SJ98]
MIVLQLAPEVVWSRYSGADVSPELKSRPARQPDLAREIAVSRRLADALARGESATFSILMQHALELCAADSAGVSVLEAQPDGSAFARWMAVVGISNEAVNGSSPVDKSICGLALEIGEARLFRHSQRCSTGGDDEVAPDIETLVVPIPGVDGPLGTLAVSSQSGAPHFDAEHCRILTSLASMAGAALRTQRTLDELGARAESAEGKVTRAREAKTRTDGFIAMLSHELRNPLAPIDAALRTIERLSTANAAVLAATEVAQRQMRRLSRLVDDLLDTTRIRHGKITVKKDYANLEEIVEDAVASVRADVQRIGQQLVVHQPAAPVTVFADASRLSQVFANLLSNAVRYTPAGRKITLTVEATSSVCNSSMPSSVYITVEDEGIGISPETLAHVFELFRQSDPEHRQADGGLGIGLAVVKYLVERHDGTVSIRSAGIGHGTTVHVALPIVRPAVAAATALQQKLVAQPTQILLVDDDADSAQALAMLLELDGH